MIMAKKTLGKLVLEMSKHLKPLTKKERDYARGIFPTSGYYKKDGEVWCHCCGHVERQLPGSLDIDLEVGYQCHCLNHLILEHNPRQKNLTEAKYYSVVQTYNKWQVIRTFDVHRINIKGLPTEYKCNEVYQNWVSPEGEEVIISKRYARGVNFFSWYYETEYTVRHHNVSCNGYYAFDDVFDVRDNFFYPQYNITKKLHKYGWCKALEKLPYVSVVDCMKTLLISRHAETVVKQGQYDVFLYMVREKLQELQYMPSLNICHRNRYMITDASIYFDMLSFLERTGKDIRNPKYICPEDLYKAHNAALAAYQKVRNKVEAEENRKKALSENEAYVKDKGKFFGVIITDGELSIQVIKSVAEFLEEGTDMHHCVFANEYYKKKDSLILSAKVAGKRKETIEVNLKTFSVVQCRAAYNKTSEYHHRILNLMNSNMNLIRQCV